MVNLWLAGYVHGDAHSNNMLVTTTKQGSVHVYIVDFGMAVQMPSTIRRAVKRAIASGQDPIAVYDTIMQPWIDRYRSSQGYSYINPNGKALKIYRAEAKEVAARELRKRSQRSNASTGTGKVLHVRV